MQYDVVMATRNRIDALRMSLPLIASQSRLPKRLIIVDSSDDHASVLNVIRNVEMPKSVDVLVVDGSISNASHQRNVGIRHVQADVIMMPDDDSLWYPDTADSVMKVYEKDADGSIGGVSSTSTSISPLSQDEIAYKINRKLLLKKKLDVARNKVEDLFIEPPYRWFSRQCPAFNNPPIWTTRQGLPTLNTMTGFRMSFRRDAIGDNPFDVDLGYKSGWCLWEDADLSLRVLASGKSLIATPESRVFHHSFPSNRSDGFDYGFSQIANYAYVCCKNMPRTPKLKKRLDNYLKYKMTLYRLKRSAFSRSAYEGARSAWRLRDVLWEAPVDHLSEAFKKVCDASAEVSYQ